MSARFPAPATRALPADPKELASVLARTPSDVLREGYVRIHAGGADSFLFLVQGKAHAAGRLEDDRLGPIKIVELFEAARGATKVELVSTDLPLLLCMEVLFRKAPSAQVPSTLVKGEELLLAIRESGKDGVLVVRNGDSRSLVFCRGGELAALYPATGEEFPGGTSIGDRVVEYVLANRSLVLDLYEEIKLPAANDAGKPFDAYASEAAARPAGSVAASAPQHTIVVRLGPRVVFRFPASAESIAVGRGEGNDILLDNLSVSRRHAVIQQVGAGWTIEDLGSDNGLVVNGAKVPKAVLAPGVEVGVGKYTLVLSRYQSGDTIVPRATPDRASGTHSHEETVFMAGPAARGAALEHGGRRHPIRGLFFDIGSATGAHLRLGGFFIAPVHARIAREKDGSFVVEHVGGFRAVRINGRKIVQAAIKDGDELAIGSHRMKFVAPQTGAAAGAADRASGAGAARLGPK